MTSVLAIDLQPIQPAGEPTNESALALNRSVNAGGKVSGCRLYYQRCGTYWQLNDDAG